jgi:hypothetical protein
MNRKTKPKAQSKQAAEKVDEVLHPKKTVKQSKNTPKKRPPKRPATSGSWIKGQSGNPNGRPRKGNAWTDIINEIMEAREVNVKYKTLNAEGQPVERAMKVAAVGSQRNIRQLLAVNMIHKALEEGDVGTMKTLIEHEVGKAMQMNVNANLTPDELPELKKGEDPIAVLLAKFTQRQ